MIDRRGPEWDCTVKEWMLWQWQATMHLNGKGYKATLEGENRDDATSGDAAVRAEYARKNGDLPLTMHAHSIRASLRGAARSLSHAWACLGEQECAQEYFGGG